jgi:hypothetical protein
MKHLRILFLFAVFLGSSFSHAENLACLGDSIPLVGSLEQPYVELEFELAHDVEPRKGLFLIDTASTISHLEQSLEPIANPTELVKIRPRPQALNFFGVSSFPAFVWSSVNHFKKNQVGIIGTSLLAHAVYALDYQQKLLFKSSIRTACTASELKNAGFLPISMKGYFSNSALDQDFQYEQVSPSKPNLKHAHVPNVPTIRVKIAGVVAVAQIDSGFNDSIHPYSVNINAAVLKLVNEKEVRLVPALDIKPSKLLTCVPGVFETTTAYRLKEGTTFEWVDLLDVGINVYHHPLFFLKNGTKDTDPCGGIGTWEIPAAQIGASFLKDLGTMVFNPFSQTLWISKQHSDDLFAMPIL